MEKQKPRSLSGVKPTGRPHIGNYMGAMLPLVQGQGDYQTFVMVADLHSLTGIHQAKTLRNYIKEIAIDYLAIGLDPRKTIIFRQSDIPAHSELAWIFDCITSIGYLQRAHAYKDALAKNKEINVGVFNYPMLMAADILLYDVDIVPVGQDQKQHVEYARDTAEKFNRLFGQAFKLPKAVIQEEVKSIVGIDGRKMSKSYNNYLSLFAEDEEIRKQVMKIPTDSKSIEEPKDPDTCQVFAWHRVFSTKDLTEIEKRYRQGGIGYKEAKEILIDNLIALINPLREKRKTIAEDPNWVFSVLEEGAERVRPLADEKIRLVKDLTGLSL
ncbi:MAG: tryptophan--tRNA ligase [Patescibacteria group bacterium]